ncbi:hypothetical protein [Streptomyces sp. NBC_00690]|uniref:hypothetical protein n=1 Tax=Streptomyces sp. NBC_00690 TaxID=2975808 RepID=UPI002E2D86D0|nr:hypothetical protein [Streptomyces sp. NBC_00690]
MTTQFVMPKAKKRPTRTHTKNVSCHPTIKLSKISPAHIDLREPLKAVLVCPDCQTWVPITGIRSRVQKLVPHHTTRAETTTNPRRCRGSNRRVEFDITPSQWFQALADAIKEAGSRQPTAVLPKTFSRQTNQTLQARAKRTPAGRVADWNTTLPAAQHTNAQRLRDELAATLRQVHPRLTPFERAEIDSRLTLLTRALYEPKPR